MSRKSSLRRKTSRRFQEIMSIGRGDIRSGETQGRSDLVQDGSVCLYGVKDMKEMHPRKEVEMKV